MTHRKVVRSGGSLVVSLSDESRGVLNVKAGSTVYMGRGGRRWIWISAMPIEKVPGTRGRLDTREIIDLRREVDRLRHQLQARPLRVFNEGVGQGWGQAMKLMETAPDGLVYQLRQDVAELRETLVQVVGGSAAILAQAKAGRETASE